MPANESYRKEVPDDEEGYDQDHGGPETSHDRMIQHNGVTYEDDFNPGDLPSTFEEVDCPVIEYILPDPTVASNKFAARGKSGVAGQVLDGEDIVHLQSVVGNGSPTAKAVTRDGGNVTGRRKTKFKMKPILSFDYATLDPDVADEIRKSSSTIRKLIKGSIVIVGKELTSIKGKLQHGEFGAWLEEEFGWTPRTAQNMMNAAALVHENELFSYLQTSVLYKLAAPSTPRAVVDRFSDEIKRGRYPNMREIKQSIDKANRNSRLQLSEEGSDPSSGDSGRVGSHPPAANANQKAIATGAPTASRVDSAKAAEAAVALLKNRLGSEFDKLLTLVVDAGSEFGLAMRALRP